MMEPCFGYILTVVLVVAILLAAKADAQTIVVAGQQIEAAFQQGGVQCRYIDEEGMVPVAGQGKEAPIDLVEEPGLNGQEAEGSAEQALFGKEGAGCVLRTGQDLQAEPADGFVGEDILYAHGEVHAPADAADQTDADDAVAAEAEEVVLYTDLFRGKTKDLGKDGAEF